MTPKSSIEILLVEDSPTDRLMAVEALESAKLINSLNVVENGEEAMAYLRREGKYRDSRRPDLILLDLNMPKKDGREVLAELKSDPFLKFIPVVILTTSAKREDVLRAYGDHANSYITKPVNFARFAEAIATLGTYWLEIVTLPPALRPQPTESEIPKPDDPDRTMRVLLVEDNPVDVLFFEDALRSSLVGQFSVTCVGRVSQVREALQREPFDIIITDLGLPDAQGLETYRQVRTCAPGLPIIVLTGDLDESIGIRSLREGAQDYLVKGQLASGALVRAIRYAIDKKSIEDQLRQSQRMEAVGRLAGGIAHDFNNLLTVVQGQASQIVTDQLSPSEIRESAQEILAASERAVGLTRQLLTFSRRQKIQLKICDLNQVVGDFSKILRRVLGEGVRIELQLSPGRIPVLADLGMLEQVLLNLAVNARDAMPNGGKVTLQTAIKELGLDDTENSSYARHFASLAVSDTGSGISAENLARVFDPFFTTKDVGEGTGLGLATVYSIVQQHGGRIEVRSDLGSGTCFDVVIPLSQMDSIHESPKAKEQPAVPSRSHETILVVEDEDSLRTMARRCLEKNGYRVLEARSGPEARVVFAEHGREIDLLFTDMMMPGGLTGRQLGDELIAQKPDLIVVYTSGYSADFSRADLELYEGVNFLQKPFGLHFLLQTIRNRLDALKS
jgi:CheY-like chemotaxis protein